MQVHIFPRVLGGIRTLRLKMQAGRRQVGRGHLAHALNLTASYDLGGYDAGLC